MTGRRQAGANPANRARSTGTRVHGLRSLLAVVALCACAGDASLAQRDSPATGIESVFFDTDAAASRKLGAARDLLAAGQWNDGIDLLRQIADQQGERIVGIAPGRYVTVQNYCDILLSTLPEEGMKIYRARTDPQARRWFEAARAARDEAALERIVRRAFLSSYGDDALDLLGQIAFEQGHLARARDWWEKLLPAESPEAGQLPAALRYPAGDFDEAQIRARLVVCTLMQGDAERAARELASFRKLYPEAQGRLGSRSGNLSELLAGIATGIGAARFESRDETLRTFAGNPRRNFAQPQPVDVGSIQWLVPFERLRQERNDGREDPFERLGLFPGNQDRGPAAILQEQLSVFPVVSDNVVFYCDEAAIYARELLSSPGGRPAWGEDAALYRLPPELFRPSVAPRRRAGTPRFTVSIDAGRVYARLGSGGTRARLRGMAAPESVLVCLDLSRQGDLAWTVRSDEMEQAGGGWIFDGAPLAVGGRVYVTLRRTDPQLQLNVACFDALTSKLIWNRKVCQGLELFGPEVEEIHHQLLTLADDRLYFNTNLGAVAAIDARDGALQWIASYPRAEIETVAVFNRRAQHGPNPCVFHEGLVLAAPTDSNRVLALDAETGVIRWQRELKGPVPSLLGVDAGRLVAAGDLLWGLDVETGDVAWTAGQSDREAATRGRGALAAGLVYWPRREEILIVETQGGRIQREVALKDQHGLTGGGNITLAEGFLLLAQSDRLVAFSEFGSLRRQRDDHITRRPDDPRPVYARALLAEAEGRAEDAVADYARVRRLAANEDLRSGQPLDRMARHREFSLLRKLADDALGRKDFQTALAHLERATAEPGWEPGRVEVVTALAGLHEEQRRPARAVAAWQSLLDGAAPRAAEQTGLPASAERLAGREIARLIDAHGLTVYAAIEEQARRRAGDLAGPAPSGRAARLARQYPNSQSLPAAIVRRAGEESSAGRTYASDSLLRTVIEQPAFARLHASAQSGLATNAELRGHWRTAAALWQQLGRQFPAATVRREDLEGPAAQIVPALVERLAEQAGEALAPVSRATPALTAQVATGYHATPAPLVRQWRKTLPTGTRSLIPEGLVPARGLASVIALDDPLTCLSARTGKVLWRTALAQPPEWCGFAGGLLVLGTNSGALGVIPEDGRVEWVAPLDESRSLDSPWRFRVAGDRLFCLGRNRVWCLSADDGRPLWQFRAESGLLQQHWFVDESRVIVQSLQPSRHIVLDAGTGQVTGAGPGLSAAWRDDPTPLAAGARLAIISGYQPPAVIGTDGAQVAAYLGAHSQSHAADAVHAAGDAAVALIDGTTLARFDARSGEQLWSCRAAAVPILDAWSALCVDATQVYVTAAGIARGVSLADGRLVWEQRLGDARGEWRLSRQGAWLCAVPATPNGRFVVALLDPQSGALIERLPCEDPARQARFHVDGHNAVLVTDRSISGYQPLSGSE